MNNRYLFSSKILKPEIINLIEESTKSKTVLLYDISDVLDSDTWILRMFIKGENITSAKILSFIQEKLLNYDVFVLQSDSSAYFNKALYPLANDFERNLRELLYLSVLKTNDERLIQLVNSVEEKNWGAIKNEFFVKKSTSGESNWVLLINDHSLDFIQEIFPIMKDYRNDIMHAHNINYEDFRKARKLLKKGNIALAEKNKRIITSAKISAINIDMLDVMIEEAIKQKAAALDPDEQKMIKNLVKSSVLVNLNISTDTLNTIQDAVSKDF